MPDAEQTKPAGPPELRFAQARPGAPSVAAEAADDVFSMVVAWLAPFALVVYLALRGGGYDAVVRMEVGIGAWVLLALVALAGVLWDPTQDRRRTALYGVLVAFGL